MTVHEERRQAALIKLGEAVVAAAGRTRHAIPDSDLYGEQHCAVQVSTDLATLRTAGIHLVKEYDR